MPKSYRDDDLATNKEVRIERMTARIHFNEEFDVYETTVELPDLFSGTVIKEIPIAGTNEYLYTAVRKMVQLGWRVEMTLDDDTTVMLSKPIDLKWYED